MKFIQRSRKAKATAQRRHQARRASFGSRVVDGVPSPNAAILGGYPRRRRDDIPRRVRAGHAHTPAPGAPPAMGVRPPRPDLFPARVSFVLWKQISGFRPSTSIFSPPAMGVNWKSGRRPASFSFELRRLLVLAVQLCP